MKTKLISGLNGIYKGLTASALGIYALTGCSSTTEIKPPPIIKSPPINSLYISPNSGISPLEVRVKGKCTSQNNINSYKVILNGNVITTRNPIDTSVIITGNSSFSSECEDVIGNITKSGPINVQVLQPSFSQTATLENYVDIGYNANLQNISQATRKTFRNDSLINTKTITGPNYFETLTSNPKGKTCFVLEALGVNPDTSCVTVPNYKPTLDTSGIQANLNEGDSMYVALRAPVDRNLEDNPVPFIFARALDGKTQVGISNGSLKIKTIGDSTGIYRVQVGFGTPQRGIDSSVVQGNIYDLPDISGNLENNETHQRIQGTMRFYTINGRNDTIPLLTKTSDSLGNNITNPDGSFRFKINRRSSDLTDILLQTRQGTPGNYSGFVRSISLPPKDTSGVLIRAIPYFPYDANPGVFRQFMQELAGEYTPTTRFDLNGEFISRFKGLQGIEILTRDPDGLPNDSLTSQQQDFIRRKILDPNDINGIVRNGIGSSKIVIGNQGHYSIDSTTKKVLPNSGWIIIVPRSTLIESGALGLTENYRVGTIVYSGTIYITPNSVDNGTVVSHEFGHMFLGTTHPTHINSNQSVMNILTTLQTTGIADKKAGMVIYEPTFMVYPSLVVPNVDRIDNLLGLSFK